MSGSAPWLLLLLLLGSVTTAQASPINYLSDERFVLARAVDCDFDGLNCVSEEGSAVPAPPFSALDASFDFDVQSPGPGGEPASATARQTSIVGPYSMTGQGYISIYDGSPPWSSVDSIFRVRFSLDEALPFSLSGSMWAWDGEARVRLETGDGTVLYSESNFDYVPLSFDHSGMLDAGVYALDLRGYDQYELSSASWSFQFTVPEPATGTLLLLGLLGLCRWKPGQRGVATSKL